MVAFLLLLVCRVWARKKTYVDAERKEYAFATGKQVTVLYSNIQYRYIKLEFFLLKIDHIEVVFSFFVLSL